MKIAHQQLLKGCITGITVNKRLMPCSWSRSSFSFCAQLSYSIHNFFSAVREEQWGYYLKANVNPAIGGPHQPSRGIAHKDKTMSWSTLKENPAD